MLEQKMNERSERILFFLIYDERMRKVKMKQKYLCVSYSSVAYEINPYLYMYKIFLKNGQSTKTEKDKEENEKIQGERAIGLPQVELA